MSLRGAWVALLRPEEAPAEEAVAADIRQELEAHIGMRAEDNVTRGMDPLEARRDAERRFGDVDRIERACRAHAIGGRIMLQRINLAVTVILGLGVIWMFFQNHHLKAEQARALEHAMSVRAQLMDRMERAKPVEYIEVAEGDELELHDMQRNWEPFRVRVARDGKILLPDAGWVHVSGLSREKAEALLTNVYSEYYAGIDVKIVVLDDE